MMTNFTSPKAVPLGQMATLVDFMHEHGREAFARLSPECQDEVCALFGLISIEYSKLSEEGRK